MNALAKKIAEDALALPEDDRAALADVLLRSLKTPAGEEIDRLWAEEAEKRVKEIEDGTVILLAGDEESFGERHSENANPWLRFAGMFEKDPLLSEVLQEIEADRRALDAEEGLP